jgi:CHAT domain-containing protein/Tfp pilus assembly protein PilF
MIRTFAIVALLLGVGVASAQLPADSPERPVLLGQRASLTERVEELVKDARYATAIQMLEERLKVEEKLFGKNGYELATTWNQLGRLALELKKYGDAAKHWAEEAKLTESKFGEKHWRTRTIRATFSQAETLAKLDAAGLEKWDSLRATARQAAALLGEGKLAEAIAILEQTAADSQALLGEGSVQHLDSLQTLGILFSQAGKPEKSVEYFEKLVALDEKLFPEGHPNTTVNRQYLGTAYRLAGDPKKAEVLLSQSIVEAKKFFKDGDFAAVVLFRFIREMSQFYAARGENEKAKKLTFESLEFAEKTIPNSEAHLFALVDASHLASTDFDFVKSENWLRSAYLLAEKLYGPKCPQQAAILGRAAELHSMMGRYFVALEEVERAISWLEASQPPEPLKLLTCQTVQALIYQDLRKGSEAVVLYRKLLEVYEKAYGEESAETLPYRRGLSNALLDTGDFAGAEASAKKVFEITKKIDPQSISAATSMIQMATMYMGVGEYRLAEPLIVQARDLLKKILGESHPVTASAEGALGNLYLEMGDYRRAELLLRNAVEVNRKALGDHPLTAKTLTNLGKYYARMGIPEKAYVYLLDSLRISKSKYPAGHPSTINELNYLGHLYAEAGRFAEAESLYGEAAASAEKAGAGYIAMLAQALTNHAYSLTALKKWPEAEKEYTKAHELWLAYQKANPAKKPPLGFATTLTGLAALHCKFDRMEEADKAIRKALEITLFAVGPSHPDTAQALVNMARLQLASKNPAAAASIAEEAIAIHRKLHSQILGFAIESEMYAASRGYRDAVALRLHIALQNPNEAKNVEGAYLASLRKNGSILDAMCQYRELERNTKPDGELTGMLRDFRATKQRLADATLNPTSQDNRAELQKLIDRSQSLQSKIHRRFSEVHPPAYAEIELQDIRAKVPRGSALVEYVRLDLQQMRPGDRTPETIHQYAAFVIPADAKEPIRFFDLGKAEEIDDTVKALGEQLQSFPPEEEDRKEKQFKRVAAKLHQLLIAPLEPALKGADSLIISPDGAINHVPFAALVNSDGKYLIETHRLRLVTGGRDLLRLPANVKGTGVAVFADPDYDADASNRGTVEPFRNGWKRLENTRKEANAIEAALKGGQFGEVRVYLGSDATEEQVKRLHSPRILHLATHGTFVQRSKSFTEADLRSSSTRQMAVLNPLLRSAIILAGANRLAPLGQIIDDGMLTADEVAFLDLGGTELVVLSACESGLGEVESGEGVVGLRRAFFHAGVRSVVATLYPVPDKETAELMTAFYKGLAAGKGKSSALRDAQLAALNSRRGNDGKHPAHPLFWAGFVLIGEGE